MGIPGLFGSFIQGKAKDGNELYESVVTEKKPATTGDGTSYVWIDVNQFFYSAAVKVYGDASPLIYSNLDKQIELEKSVECYYLILQYIAEVIEMFRPKDGAMISVDGVVPLGKMQHQKGRRYASAAKLAHDAMFDKNAFTPGTEWMAGLDIFLKRNLKAYFESYARENLRRGTSFNYIYSSYRVPGEGEHKIFDMLRNKSVIGNTYGMHVIYSADADLIVLSLVSSYRDRIIIAREDQNRNRKLSYISIKNLTNALRQDLGQDDNKIPSFAFVMSFVGNDFLYKTPSMMNKKFGIESMLDVLKGMDSRQYIIDHDGNIKWDNLLRFLVTFTREKEPVLLFERIRNERPDNLTLVEQQTPKGDYTTFRNLWYSMATKHLQPLFGKLTSEDVEEIVTDMCLSYLRGLAWVWSYYKEGGDRVTWHWYYPYFYGPLTFDIYNVLQRVYKEGKYSLLNPFKRTNEVTPSPIHQLVAVMPTLSLHHVPQRLHVLWSEDSPILDLMPAAIVVDKDEQTRKDTLKSFNLPSDIIQRGRVNKILEEARSVPHYIYPHVDLYRVMKAVEALDLPGRFITRYSREDTYVERIRR